MGRKYSVLMPGISVTVAKDLLRIKSVADKVTYINRAQITQEASETSEQLPLLVQRASTDGTGTSATPEKKDPGDAAYGGTVVTNLTADTTLTGAPIWRSGQNIINGWDYFPAPEDRLTLGGQGRAVVRLPVAPGAALTVTVDMDLEEVG